MSDNQLCMGCMNDRSNLDQCPHCGFGLSVPPQSALHLPPGTLLNDKYLIGRALGQGGFGITYLAWDINLKIKLAIKEYFPRQTVTRQEGHSKISPVSSKLDSQYQYGKKKFLQEAQTLAQFDDHPNIVSVRDYFKANDTAYIVMSYLDGVTLKEYLTYAGNKLPLDTTLTIMMPILDALKDLHAVGMLHRDVSPDNIMISRKGQVILLDFGAARQAFGEKGNSLTVILRQGYTPEEQYRSRKAQGPWTDLYAAAATMYRMLTGTVPPDSLNRLEKDGLIPPTRLGANLRAHEENALLKALAVRANERFPRVQAFQDAILFSGKDTAQPAEVSWGKPDATIIPENQPLPDDEVKEVISPPQQAKTIAPAYTQIPANQGYPEQDGFGPASLRFRNFNRPKGKKLNNWWLIIPGAVVAIALGLFIIASLTSIPEEEPIIVDLSQGEIPGEGGGQPAPMPPPDSDPGPGPDPGDGYIEDMPYFEGTYSGEIVNGVPHGRGYYVEPGVVEYEGQWVEGVAQGTGTFRYPDGSVYEGDVYQNLSHGQGRMTTNEGVTYEGTWVEGQMQGQGALTLPDGTEYRGEFHQGMFHGQGTLTLPDGTTFTGRWENGEYVGP